MSTNDSRSAKRQRQNNSSAGNKSKYRAQGAANNKKHHGGQNYRGSISSASGLQSGDVGIFVTCDKGKEKACLREMEDLLTAEMGLAASDGAAPESEVGPTEDTGDVENEDLNGSTTEPALDKGGIEDEIQRELAEMAETDIVDSKKRKRGHGDSHGWHHQDSKKPLLGLVTLDIPCVTFVRFPSSQGYDPVSIVTKMCAEAKTNPQSQRSRFVKRLTPLTRVRKVMSGGVEELCREILPSIFGGDGHAANDEDAGNGYKYAIRVTVRNNNQVSKDDIIKTVAEEVRRLGLEGSEGQSRHEVDLKGYDKLVMVEVYRNVVGMAVVGDDFEALRRFNLAEIYADSRRDEEAVKESSSSTKPQQAVD